MTDKQKDTLKRMKEVRYEDCVFLRNIITEKLEWAKIEKEKGIKVIEKQLQQVKENKETITKLDGIIMVLTELLEIKKEEEPKKE